jgi:hypothetical protein
MYHEDNLDGNIQIQDKYHEEYQAKNIQNIPHSFLYKTM